MATDWTSRVREIADSCHCPQPTEPSPCDGWLRHRRCDFLQDALAALAAEAFAAGHDKACEKGGLLWSGVFNEGHAAGVREERYRVCVAFSHMSIRPSDTPADYLVVADEYTRFMNALAPLQAREG
jgi:hypothetical protein